MPWRRCCRKSGAPCRDTSNHAREDPRHARDRQLKADAAHVAQNSAHRRARVRRVRPDNCIHKSWHRSLRSVSILARQRQECRKGQGDDRRPPCLQQLADIPRHRVDSGAFTFTSTYSEIVWLEASWIASTRANANRTTELPNSYPLPRARSCLQRRGLPAVRGVSYLAGAPGAGSVAATMMTVTG
jgi:hypothetical protein